MKNLYLLVILTFFCLDSFSQAIDSVINNDGKWNVASTWSLNRVPKSGDTIVIPTKMQVIIDNNVVLGNVYISMTGKIKFQDNSSSLSMGNGSTIVLYDNASINGNNSGNQTINIGSNTVYEGGKLQGPLYANASTGSGFMVFNNVSIPGSGTTSTLPVKFTALNATKRVNDVLIQWNVENEVNVRSYEVERSYDGKSWETIATVSAANFGNYSYSDKNIVSGNAYYHIKQLDNNGSFAYSTIKMLSLQSTIPSTEVKILSMQNRVVLQFLQQVKGNVAVRFVARSGQVVGEQVLNAPVGQVILNQNSSLHGDYFVSVSNGSTLNMTSQVIL